LSPGLKSLLAEETDFIKHSLFGLIGLYDIPGRIFDNIEKGIEAVTQMGIMLQPLIKTPCLADGRVFFFKHSVFPP
jgi:hypothetical protein